MARLRMAARSWCSSSMATSQSRRMAAMDVVRGYPPGGRGRRGATVPSYTEDHVQLRSPRDVAPDAERSARRCQQRSFPGGALLPALHLPAPGGGGGGRQTTFLYLLALSLFRYVNGKGRASSSKFRGPPTPVSHGGVEMGHPFTADKSMTNKCSSHVSPSTPGGGGGEDRRPFFTTSLFLFQIREWEGACVVVKIPGPSNSSVPWRGGNGPPVHRRHIND